MGAADGRDGHPAALTGEPAPPGSRWESAGLVTRLVLDLASTPFHLLVYVCRRRRHRARFARTLEEHSA